jgi:hypothetical protein
MRDFPVAVRFTQEERQVLETVRRDRGETVSALVRRLAMPQARRLARDVDRERAANCNGQAATANIAHT